MIVLDTDALSEVLRKRPNRAFLARLREVPARELYTTVISLMELRYGSARRPDHERFWGRIAKTLLPRVHYLRFDASAAVIAGDLQAQLDREGAPIGLADVQIAAITLRHDATLVTGNTRHFERVPDLRLENWLR